MIAEIFLDKFACQMLTLRDILVGLVGLLYAASGSVAA